jgi:hypothetical protein
VQTSEQINEIATALAKAQGVMDAAGKDAANPHFKSKFASLASVREAIRKPLSDNGLAYTRLIHSSGQFIGDTLRVPLAQATPQGVGSASSYGRRYALMAIVGLAAEDDDAEAAHGRTGNGVRSISARAQVTGPTPIANGEPNDGEEYDDSAPRNAYIAMCKEIILNTNKSEADVREWWKGEQQSRRDFDLSQTEVNLLKSVIAERFRVKA